MPVVKGINRPNFEIFCHPKVKSRLYISPQLSIDSLDEMPNWWWRMWHWIFFGFTWEDGDDNILPFPDIKRQ